MAKKFNKGKAIKNLKKNNRIWVYTGDPSSKDMQFTIRNKYIETITQNIIFPRFVGRHMKIKREILDEIRMKIHEDEFLDTERSIEQTIEDEYLIAYLKKHPHNKKFTVSI